MFLRNLALNYCQFHSKVLVLSNICHKMCLVLAHYYKIYLNFGLTFLSKSKKLLLDIISTQLYVKIYLVLGCRL